MSETKGPTAEEARGIFQWAWQKWDSNRRMAREYAASTIQRVIEAGSVAIYMKEILPHGQFLPWLKSCGPDVDRATVWRWMGIVKKLSEHVLGPNVAHATFGRLSDGQVKLLAERMVGKTMNDLYREAGVIPSVREARVKRLGSGKLSPEEQLRHDLIVRASAVRDGVAFCHRHGGELEAHERGLIAWAAFDALRWLLPDGEMVFVTPGRKRLAMEELIGEQIGRRGA